MSDLLLLDEWLWADLSGQNKRDKQKETFRFLEILFEKCDRFININGSPFETKFKSLLKSQDFIQREIGKVLGHKFWWNSNKTLLLPKEDELTELPDSLSHTVPSEDRYLVRAYLYAEASEFVTTDGTLRKALINCGVDCKWRDEFVSNYIATYEG